MPKSSRRWPLAAGLAAGVALDALFGDPRRGHPVAAFGRAAAALEARDYADSRRRGAAHAAVCVLAVAAPAAALHRRTRGWPSWQAVAVAENTSDAVVAPLLWGAVAGLPGLAAYRAVNTLDAMVGHRSARYLRFGWASARLDDLANWVPARVTAALTAACAPLVTGARPVAVLNVVSRDGGHHPSPNAGWCEAAFAAALGVRLGGTNVYAGVAETRPYLNGRDLGDGRPPEPEDIRRAVALSRAVTLTGTALAVLIAVLTGGGRS
jgi:adenosylcobinamide-phosphate synthase